MLGESEEVAVVSKRAEKCHCEMECQEVVDEMQMESEGSKRGSNGWSERWTVWESGWLNRGLGS